MRARARARAAAAGSFQRAAMGAPSRWSSEAPAARKPLPRSSLPLDSLPDGDGALGPQHQQQVHPVGGHPGHVSGHPGADLEPRVARSHQHRPRPLGAQQRARELAEGLLAPQLQQRVEGRPQRIQRQGRARIGGRQLLVDEGAGDGAEPRTPQRFRQLEPGETRSLRSACAPRRSRSRAASCSRSRGTSSSRPKLPAVSTISSSSGPGSKSNTAAPEGFGFEHGGSWTR